MTTNQSIAATILATLGGNKLVAMVGANGFLNLENGLQFKFKGSRKSNCVRITLDTAQDLYTVEFFKIKGFDVEATSKHTGLYDVALKGTFERATGLSLSL